MRRILPVVISIIFSLSCSAATLDDVTSIHDAAYRLGISEVPENKYVEAKQESKAEKLAKEYVKTQENKSDISELTYADLSIKQISKEISTDLEIDKETMTGDLSLLWQGAASQSDTINFALYKLANPEEDKPDEKSVKKVLQTIAGMSTLIGAGMGNPILATGSILGGNVLGIMSQDTKALNYKYSKVTDADMIILVRKVEDLQQKTVDLYYEYMTSRQKEKFRYVPKFVA